MAEANCGAHAGCQRHLVAEGGKQCKEHRGLVVGLLTGIGVPLSEGGTMSGERT